MCISMILKDKEMYDSIQSWEVFEEAKNVEVHNESGTRIEVERFQIDNLQLQRVYSSRMNANKMAEVLKTVPKKLRIFAIDIFSDG